MADWPNWQAPHAELVSRLSRGEVGDYATSLSSLDLPGKILRRVAAQFIVTQSMLQATEVRKRHFPPRKPGRLRIAYLSSDFRNHATSRLLVEVLERHDRERFEVFAFALTPPDGSALGQRVVAACEHFIEVANLAAVDVAARILECAIDVLIDLNGHTKGGCVGLAALRPAPVVVNYLGYPGTMGDYVDYIIGDRYTTPPGSEDEFSEAVVRLPGCYQANDRRRAVGAPAQRTQHGLADGAIVACSFNQSWKITPTIWVIWMRLLHAHPRLVLWLIDENRWMRQNLIRAAADAGIDAGRLVFAPRVAQPEHLARLALADLALDTVPCNSHTTGSDALWMGVPMVTLLADSFAGRVGASLLHAVDLPELVTRSKAEYEAKLDALIGAPAELVRLKTTLLERRDHVPLFDSTATARTLERAYSIMHERHVSGLAPAPIDMSL
jgi:predicted O-linked N-acetylglucosamine transferase (SPINDLY family)